MMSYLCDNYGTKILSGQYCDTGEFGKEFQVIKKATDKTPAVLGLDFMEYTPSRVENGSVGHSTDLAMQFWKDGGIVTFCWHWNAPSKYLTGQWYSGFYTESTNIDLAKIMNGEDQEGYDLLMEDIDAIASQLKILQEAGVPVLWRPLHEASGGWFWWGASGADAYKKLYILLYDKMTNEYGLNNLIWVWNGQDADWYPGDEYVDIIGEDIYPGERVYTSQVNKYLEAVHYTEAHKMVVLSENGCVFDPDLKSYPIREELTKVGEIIIANILFLVCCLPVVTAATTIYLFPVLSRFEMRLPQMVKLSFVMCLRYLPYTLLIAAGTALVGWLLFYKLPMACTLVLPGAWCLAITFLMEKAQKEVRDETYGEREKSDIHHSGYRNGHYDTLFIGHRFPCHDKSEYG